MVYPQLMDIRCQTTQIAMSFAQSENILVSAAWCPDYLLLQWYLIRELWHSETHSYIKNQTITNIDSFYHFNSFSLYYIAVVSLNIFASMYTVLADGDWRWMSCQVACLQFFKFVLLCMKGTCACSCSQGISAHTEDLLRNMDCITEAQSKGLVVFCWGDDNNEHENRKLLREKGIDGLIYDRFYDFFFLCSCVII